MNRVLHLSIPPVRLGPQRLKPFLLFLSACILFSCAGSSHPRVIPPGEGIAVPRFIELNTGAQIATLHFPAGTYELNAEDKIGYYYRLPGKISEHIGGGAVGRDGGIFVSKRSSQKLRGYIYRAGAITLVGNLSHSRHQFRN